MSDIDNPRIRAEMATNELRKSVLDVLQNEQLICEDDVMRQDVREAIMVLANVLNRYYLRSAA